MVTAPPKSNTWQRFWWIWPIAGLAIALSLILWGPTIRADQESGYPASAEWRQTQQHPEGWDCWVYVWNSTLVDNSQPQKLWCDTDVKPHQSDNWRNHD